MSANYIGNSSQGYFGFYLGPTGASDISSVAETLTLADLVTAVVVYQVDRSESLAIADSQGVSAALAAIISEGLSSADSVSSAAIFIDGVIEILSASDQESSQAVFTSILEEALSANDSVNSSLDIAVGISEVGLSISDSQDGQTSDTTVSEFLDIQDVADSTLIPNPAPPAPDNSATTMAPSAGAQIDKSRARPLRYNFDGKVEIKLYDEAATQNVESGPLRDSALFVSRLNSSLCRVSTTIPRFARETASFKSSVVTPLVERRIRAIGHGKSRGTSSSFASGFGCGVSRSKSFGFTRGVGTHIPRARSTCRGHGFASGHSEVLSSTKTRSAKAYAFASGEHSVEFTQEQTEMIFAAVHREFFE